MIELVGLQKEIWEKKYKHKTDETIEDTWQRVAKAIASVEQDKEYWEEQFYNILEDFKFIPGGRITNGAGTDNNYLLNCSVIPIYDSIAGEQSIARTAEIAAQMAKCNYGVGIDFSPIRPKNSDITVGGKASGVVSFMKVFDTWCSVIQDGGGRRAALIGILRVDHPDILEFISCKREQGVLTQFNISVGLTEKFTEAVKADTDFNLEFNGKIYQTVKAKEIWDKLVKSGYEWNDPGYFVLDKVNKYNNGYYLYDIACSNPCFTGDMKLLTVQGYKTFEELENKSIELINYRGETTNGRVWATGVKPIVKLKFHGNVAESITCTPDHVFLTVDSEELQAKDLTNKRIKPFVQQKIKFSRKPFFAGFIQGDGNTGRLDSEDHNGLEVNLGEKDKDVANFLSADVSGRTWYSTEAKNIAKEYNLSPKQLPEREFPNYVFQSESELNDFLSGLWSANGSVIKKHRVAFKSTCKGLIDTLSNILYENGIENYVTTNKPTKVKFSNGEFLCKESYDLNINKFASIVKFAEKIGFCQKYKREALDELVNIKAPKIRSVIPAGEAKVYDFNEPETHWGVVNGLIAHNCGEIPLPPWGVCDLGNINLTKFIVEPFSDIPWKENFKWAEYETTIKTAVRFLDNVLDVSAYPYKELEDRARGDRRIGLNGVAGLGSFLAMLQIPYDSQTALAIAEHIQQFLTETAYAASVEIAKEKGSFPNFDAEKFTKAEFVLKTFRDSDTLDDIYAHGIRNIALTTIPPVGTGSLLAGNISNGLEPIFALEYNRNVRQLDGSKKTEAVEDYAWKLWKELQENKVYSAPEIKPDFFKTSREISPKAHVDMQATLQVYIDGSISKTANIPESFTLKEYEELLWYAIEKECKGFTTFRAGTREGVLEVKSEKKQKVDEKIKAAEPKKKRARVLAGRTYKISDPNGNWYVTINDIEEKGKVRPFEIFIAANGKNNEQEEWHKLTSKNWSAIMRRTDDISFLIDEAKSIYSQSGYFADGRYNKSKPEMLASILEEHIESLKGETKKESKKAKCPECGNMSYSKEGGCGKCLDCGYSQCS